MKIAFDLRRMGNPGVGRYMRCLVEAIVGLDANHEYVLLLPPDQKINTGKVNAVQFVPRSRYYSVGEQIELPRILRQQKVDLLHSPHFLLPLVQTCPAVVTIHDVIYLACPQDMESRAGRLYYSGMIRASARLARKIITVSEFSKWEIVRYLGVDPEKVQVIYPAVGPQICHPDDEEGTRKTLAKYGINCDYVFYSSIYKQRKNHAGLLRAFGNLIGKRVNAQLVLAGPLKSGERDLRRLAEQLGISESIIFTGFVSDEELAVLYSAARVYACPSLYEGFGFTVLEAMACGAPVVSSNAASLPEVAGDAALFADAGDPGEFGDTLYQLFTDESLRVRCIERGFQNMRRFSWDEAAKRCLELYSSVSESARREVAFA